MIRLLCSLDHSTLLIFIKKTQMNNIKNKNIEKIQIHYDVNIAKTLFAPISHLPWAMLLRSASDTHSDSRFDILVAKPLVTLTTVGKNTEIVTAEQVYHSQACPFELIEQWQNDYIPSINDVEDLPFVGGALGYFSYDLNTRLEKIPQLTCSELNTADLMVGLYDWALVVDHLKKTATVVGQDPYPYWQWLRAQPSTILEPFILKSDWSANLTFAEYQQKFDAIQSYLKAGDCYQINLAMRFNADYVGNEWMAYLKLEHENKAPFSAFIKTPTGAIISVSPERFLKLTGNKIETKPIKGTRPRSAESIQDEALKWDLLNSEKDLSENLMIVDLLRNDIGKVAKPGSVCVPKLFQVESFHAVHHLVTTIEGTLTDHCSPSQLLKACFPGGSITGAPKIRAMTIIEELEPDKRSVYCGSIGYISCNGHMDTNISIRTLVAENGRLYAWGGGAIVSDSKVEDEYQEIKDKLSKILPVLTKHH